MKDKYIQIDPNLNKALALFSVCVEQTHAQVIAAGVYKLIKVNLGDLVTTDRDAIRQCLRDFREGEK